MSNILVINTGSSSLKYAVVDPDSGKVAVSDTVEEVEDHGAEVRQVLEKLGGADSHDIVAVGHRVVHGGDIDGPRLIDDALCTTIDELKSIAPLHNPINLRGITTARELMPDLPHVAVFDTAWFHDLPPAAATYAVDRATARAHGIRRYGAHGTSHAYVSAEVARRLGRDDLRMVVLHLGNGASAAAVSGGRPVEISMGLTPLEGLVMGTRSGDIDPSVIGLLHREAELTVDDAEDLLIHSSGMLGLTGKSDMREVVELADSGDEGARLGLEVYAHRVRKYIGAYAAVLGGLDVLVFTAGIGENSDRVRADAVAGLEFLGIQVDAARNRESESVISTDDSAVTVLVVPTDEELEIARQTMGLIAPS